MPPLTATSTPVPMCTIRRHPLGGYSPIFHLSDVVSLEVDAYTISFPAVRQAVQYAYNHFGLCPVEVDEECAPPHAA